MTDFSNIDAFKNIPHPKRISQSGILPTAVKFRTMEFFDPTDGTYKFKDNAGNAIFTIDPRLGTITFGSNLTFTTPINFSDNVAFTDIVTFGAAVTFNGTVSKGGIAPSAFVKEIRFPIFERGSSLSTDQATYQNLNIAEFLFNPADYPSTTITLEAICRAGAFGDPARTLYVDLFDVTGNAVITGSEMSTATTEESGGNATAGALVRLRGSDFRANLTTGARTYIPRYKSGTAGLFVDIYKMELVITY